MNPRAAINDLLPFQGSPFGQLGYFSKLPYFSLLCSQKRCLLYRITILFVKQIFKFFQIFFYLLQTSGESGIRTHAPLRTNGFQDRLVMTTSISLRTDIYCALQLFLSAQKLFYHQKQGVSIQILQFLQKGFTYRFAEKFPLH